MKPIVVCVFFVALMFSSVHSLFRTTLRDSTQAVPYTVLHRGDPVWSPAIIPSNSEYTLFSPFVEQTQSDVYATLGPEAPAILRVLVGQSHVVTLQAGDLSNALQTQTFTALVVSQDWVNDDDLKAAQRAGVRVVIVQRHTSIAHMEGNIRTLATLTGMQTVGQRWIAAIDQAVAQVKEAVHGTPRTRVLILTPEGYTEGQGALITELIEIAGGLNVAAEANIAEARQIDDSQIRDFAPDVVLLINWTAESAAAVAHNPLYVGLPAFDYEHIYRFAISTQDPAQLREELPTLATLFHPPTF
ncbi:MAG: ABC transporter substrate-binding protein [Chloroflexota bacterium]